MKVREKSAIGYQQIIDSMGDAVIASDEEGQILLANRAAYKLLGYQPGELAGKEVYQLFSAVDGEGRAHAQDILSGGAVEDFEAAVIDKHGANLAVCVSLSALVNLSGLTGGVVYVLRNVGSKRRTERKYQALFEQAPGASLVVNTFDQVVSVNAGAARLFGFEQADLAGQPIAELVSTGKKGMKISRFEDLFAQQSDGVPGIGPELYGRRKDGSEFSVEVNASPVSTDDGTVLLVNLRDVTEEKNEIRRLKEYGSRLETSNRELEQFAYVASHDLQEQLRNITNYVGLIEKYSKVNTDEEFNYFLGVISASSLQMNTLIRELLEFSRIGRHQVVEKVDCTRVVAGVLSDMDGAIRARRASIRVGDLPVIGGSTSEIRQLFHHLLDNGLKFSRLGIAPEMVIQCEDKADYWEFSIRDNGIGISSDYFKKIFLIFQRLHPVEEYPGLGMGLAVCKKIVERNNGQIWVNALLGEGSVFYFTIPK